MPEADRVRQGGKLWPLARRASPLVELLRLGEGGFAHSGTAGASGPEKGSLTLFRLAYGIHGKFSSSVDPLRGFIELEIALDFVSANPSVVKSIKQRELLNIWLRLYARNQRMPHVAEYQPERLADELPDLVYYSVDAAHEPPRLTIQSDGTRMSSAYGHTGKGKPLDEYVGARLAPIVMPVYHQCVRRKLPVYTIAHLDDVYGRVVAYERLLLPFSEAEAVTQLIPSLKTISEDGEFEIKNLMRGHDAVPRPKLCAVIDRDLFHRRPGRIDAGDVVEFG